MNKYLPCEHCGRGPMFHRIPGVTFAVRPETYPGPWKVEIWRGKRGKRFFANVLYYQAYNTPERLTLIEVPSGKNIVLTPPYHITFHERVPKWVLN